MDNFQFYAPTKILFGKGELSHLPKELKKSGSRVLLTYGGGSVKRTGIYDKVTNLLKENGFDYFELAGIEPNPRLETVIKGVEICRTQNIDMILAVGGGSTIDCSKVIGAAVNYDGSPWDIVVDSKKITKVLPIYTVLTMAATGSEMNGGAVITNMKLNQKQGTGNPGMKPKTSVLDPTFTFSVPKYQTAAGSADILSHLFENYFSVTKGAAVQDRAAEGLMKSVIQYAPIALAEPENYDARANIMWTSTLALNGLTGSGKVGSWSCHPMEHVLSAFYDITHGIGLAILTPRWMKYILSEKTVDKFVDFATNVWGLPMSEDKFALAEAGIQKLYDFFESLEIPMTLPEVGIDESKLVEMAEDAVQYSSLSKDSYVPLTVQDVVNIYTDCLTKGF